MRYPEGHKAEVHDRLIQIAGRVLRLKGPEAVSVVEVMREAGLTHGGFYAHFKSKDALLVEALEAIFRNARLKYGQQIAGLPPRHALASFVDSYVSATHRDHPEAGCALTALNSDLPRQSQAVREAFDRGTKAMIAWFARTIEKAGIATEGEGLAAAVVSAMVGAVAISRTIADPKLADEILASTRESIKARLGVTDRELSRSSLS